MNYKDKIDANAHYFALMDTVTDYGFIRLANAGDSDWVECVIDESHYKVDEGYKVTLVPLSDKFASRHFYQCDFISMMNSGHIVKVEDNKKYSVEHVVYHEPLVDGIPIVHSANVLVDSEK